MTDFAIALSSGVPALSSAAGDIATDSGLRAAVIVSLFTDRRAANDDEIPDGTDDRRGSWQDQYLEDPNDLQGSRLWLLSREKQLPSVLTRAKEYAEEALQWLVDDGVATAVTVTPSWASNGWLDLRVRIDLPGDTPFEDVFNYPVGAA